MSQFTESWYRAQLAKRNPRPECPTHATDNEGDLQDQIIQFCRGKGWYVDYSRMDLPTTRPKGVWDLGVYADRGRVWLVECKARGGKRSPEQIGVAMLMERLGHKVHLVYSFEEFLQVVNSSRNLPAGMSPGDAHPKEV